MSRSILKRYGDEVTAMKIKKTILLTLVVFLIILVPSLLTLWSLEPGKVDKVNTNDLLKTVEETGADSPEVKQKMEEYRLELEYVNGTPVLYYNNAYRFNQIKKILTFILFIIIVVCVLAMLTSYLYLERRVLRPFRRLKDFAGNIAAGNLDLSLRMDEDNIFGAFTESFDLMREQLKEARESERRASQSKKELVASLSHDIKTPLASIMTISELLTVTVAEEAVKQKLGNIHGKAEQIEVLVNNLFHSALEELQELKVKGEEFASTNLHQIILTADYEHKIMEFTLEACLIYCDPLRIQQVFDNILSNSYKYAGTPIAVDSWIDHDRLCIRLRDWGTGIDPEELPLLKKKFYRGKNSEGKSGTGIGLYVSDYFMEKMGGSLELEDCRDGFSVILSFRIV